MKFIIENVLNQPHVIIFLLGYVSGILTICLYLWFFKKPEYSEQLSTIQQLFKISVFGIPDGSNVKQEVVTTRARTRSDAEKEVTRLKRSSTVSTHKASQEVTNYFMTLLTILRKIKSIKELKSDVQVAEDKIKNIQDKYYL